MGFIKMVPFLKSASRLCCFSSLLRLLYSSRFSSVTQTEKKRRVGCAVFACFRTTNSEYVFCFRNKHESATCKRMLKLRLPRSGLDSMDPTRHDRGAAVTRRMASSIRPPPCGAKACWIMSKPLCSGPAARLCGVRGEWTFPTGIGSQF